MRAAVLLVVGLLGGPALAIEHPHLQRVAADLQDRVAAGQITQARACEVLGEVVQNTQLNNGGQTTWRFSWHQAADAVPEGHRVLRLPLNCPGRTVVAAPETRLMPGASPGPTRTNAAVLQWSFGLGIGVLLVAMGLVWRRSAQAESALQALPVPDGLTDLQAPASLRAERDALIAQVHAQLGALEAQVQRMRAQRRGA